MSSRARSRSAPRAELGGAASAAVVGLALFAAGCGADEPAASVVPPPDRADEIVDISGTVAPVGEMTAGSVASLVECRDWNGASQEERIATLADVRSQINLEDSGISTPALTDEETQEFFDGACEPAYAQGFRLYKLYARATGFITLKRELDE